MPDTILTSSVLIIAVMLLRVLLARRINRRLRYAMWLPVLLRLMIPIALIPSPVSILNTVDTQVITEPAREIILPVFPTGTVTGPYYTDEITANGEIIPYTGPREPVTTQLRWFDMSIWNLAHIIWLSGSIILGLWFIHVNTTYKYMLIEKRIPAELSEYQYKLPVYIIDTDTSPCMFGLIRPSIYLTPKAARNHEALRFVLEHEYIHYRHLDHIWTFLRVACLCVYWFNPLVWIAAIESRKDCELACDESVINRLGEENRVNYGRVLIELIPRKRGSNMSVCATTMAAGSGEMKKRIKMIAEHRKTVLSALIVTIVIIGAVVGCTFTGRERDRSDTELSQKLESGMKDSDPIMRAAWSLIEEVIRTTEEVSAEHYADAGGGTVFTDAEITRLTPVYRYTEVYRGADIEAYALEYRIKPSEPSKIVLSDGMVTDGDGWLLEDTSIGKPWIVAEIRNGKTSVLGIIYPDGELGIVQNSIFGLLYRLESEAGRKTGRYARQMFISALTVSDGKVIMRIPYDYPNPVDWNIQITGRAAMDDGYMSVHLFSEENAARSWERGGVYEIEIEGKNYESLYLAVQLPSEDPNEGNNTLISLLALYEQSNPGMLGKTGAKDLETAISETILEKGYEMIRGREFETEAHVILHTQEWVHPVTKQDMICAYIIADYAQYEFQNGEFTEASGYWAAPMALTYIVKESGEHILSSLERLIVNNEPIRMSTLDETLVNDTIEKASGSSGNMYMTRFAEEREEAAREYLEQIGRGGYEITKNVTKKYPPPDEAPAFENLALWFFNYPNWLGTRELREDGVRIVYRTEYESGELIYTKETEYGEIIARFRADAKSGELLEEYGE